MKNTAINTLNYTGIVTLSQYIGSQRIELARKHNSGGSPLFDFLADCLIGNFTMAKLLRPTKIMLVKRTENKDPTTGAVSSYSYESKSGFIYLLTKPEKIYSSTQCKVRYSFIVPKDQLESITDYKDLGIGLYTNAVADSATDSGSLENYAAFCLLDNNDLSKSTRIGAALVVDWELIISNIS